MPIQDGKYIPNSIPAIDRIKYSLTSIGLLAFGTYGLMNDDIVIPLSHGARWHLHAHAAYFIYASIVFVCLAMLSVVVDHYDKSNTEEIYRKIVVGNLVLAALCVVIAFAFHGEHWVEQSNRSKNLQTSMLWSINGINHINGINC